MTPPKKTCFLVIPTGEDMPDGMTVYDYAVEQHDYYMPAIAKSLCGVAGTDYHHPMPGVWMLNGYDDWAGVLQDSLNDAGLKYSHIATSDTWRTNIMAQLECLSTILEITANL